MSFTTNAFSRHALHYNQYAKNCFYVETDIKLIFPPDELEPGMRG